MNGFGMASPIGNPSLPIRKITPEFSRTARRCRPIYVNPKNISPSIFNVWLMSVFPPSASLRATISSAFFRFFVSKSACRDQLFTVVRP
jgi:hypothetical protein